MEKYYAKPEMSLLRDMDVSLEQYCSYLVETFHHTRENPFSQVLSATKLRRDQHNLFKKYISHALAEVKHDLLALNDFAALGGDIAYVTQNAPLESTQELIDFTYTLANKETPLYYLGYLYHVEMLPTQNGQAYIDMLKNKGLPENSYTFLAEHVEVDIQHNKMMRYYIDKLVNSSQDLEIFIQGMNEGINLHFKMVLGALNNPIDMKKSRTA